MMFDLFSSGRKKIPPEIFVSLIFRSVERILEGKFTIELRGKREKTKTLRVDFSFSLSSVEEKSIRRYCIDRDSFERSRVTEDLWVCFIRCFERIS